MKFFLLLVNIIIIGVFMTPFRLIAIFSWPFKWLYEICQKAQRYLEKICQQIIEGFGKAEAEDN